MHDRISDFEPPHCPNPACSFHRDPSFWPFKKAGFYTRKAIPHSIQRFRCLRCGQYFSTQTFSTTYWLKLPNLLSILFHRSLGCSALRQIARELDVAPSTVMHQIERLGRHCLLFQQLHTTPVNEPLVIDGFETFEFSQYYPFHINVAVGAYSHFVYAFTDAELRRKGRMTKAQKIRRKQLEDEFGRPDPKAIEKEVAELMRLALPRGGEVEITSDEHKAYPRAFRRVPNLNVKRHLVVASSQPRTRWNPLFPVNLLDLLIRHSGANHKRETIAFSKRRQGSAERMAILQVWRNYMKSFSENKRDESPAEKLGVIAGKLKVGQILSRRLFPSLVRLPKRLMGYYRRETETRQILNCRQHRLVYAF